MHTLLGILALLVFSLAPDKIAQAAALESGPAAARHLSLPPSLANPAAPLNSLPLAVDCAAAAPSALVGCPWPAITGTLGSGSPNYASTSGTQTTRLTRNGEASQCGAAKAFPGTTGSDTHTFDAYGFRNLTGKAQCVTVTLDAQTCTGPQLIFASAYLGPFDPADVAANYLGDAGSSPQPTGAFSFTVPAGAAFTIVVHEANNDPNPGTNCPLYSFSLDSLPQPALIAGALGGVPADYPSTGGLQSARLTRNGVASECGSTKTVSSTAGLWQYQAFSFVNTDSADRCVTVTVSAGQCDIFASAYAGAFDPASVTANYLGDAGSSTGAGGGRISFSFDVPAGETFVVVVNEIVVGTGCADYDLMVTGLPCQIFLLNLPLTQRE